MVSDDDGSWEGIEKWNVGCRLRVEVIIGQIAGCRVGIARVVREESEGDKSCGVGLRGDRELTAEAKNGVVD